jgi:threonine-phosphate decarboxylase
MKRSDRHGGDVYAVARETGRPVSRLLDFSANINPLGPPAVVQQALLQALPSVRHYPDFECAALREALAERHRCSPASFLIGNGSIELIYALPRALSIGRALIVGPTFSEYERAVRLANGRCTLIMAKRTSGYRPPLARAAAAAVRSPKDAVFICNPNSPTGQAVSREEFLRFLRPLSDRGVWCIVDETFVEFASGCSVMDDLADLPYLVVLRSFTKFFALPGLRLGYLAGHPEVVERVSRFVPAWTVNALAQAAGMAALRAHRHSRRTVEYLEREREYLAERLSQIAGLRIFPSVTNFLLIELSPRRSAGTLTRSLRRGGILIRDCSAVPGLSSRTIRVAVRTRKDNERLVGAMKRVIGNQ